LLHCSCCSPCLPARPILCLAFRAVIRLQLCTPAWPAV
jgi:hypothetical protein